MVEIAKKDIIKNCYSYDLFTGGIGIDYGADIIGVAVLSMSVANANRQMQSLADLNVTVIAHTPSYA